MVLHVGVEEKPQKSTNMSVLYCRRTVGQFLGRSSSVIARMTPQTRKGRCPGAEQLFGMYNIHYTCLKRRRRRKKLNKIDILKFGFLDLAKG